VASRETNTPAPLDRVPRRATSIVRGSRYGESECERPTGAIQGKVAMNGERSKAEAREELRKAIRAKGAARRGFGARAVETSVRDDTTLQDMLMELAGDDPAVMRMAHEALKDPLGAQRVSRSLSKKLGEATQSLDVDAPPTVDATPTVDVEQGGEEEEGLPECMLSV